MDIKHVLFSIIVFLMGVNLFPAAVLAAGAAPLQQKQWREAFQPGGRVGYVDTYGNLKVRAHTDPGAPWVTVAKNVKDFQLRDTRIAVCQNDGTLRFWDGPLDNMLWQVIDTEAAAYQLGVSRVGILHVDSTFLLTEWGAPVPIAIGVKAFQVLPDRIGILGFDGSFWVQEGLSTEKFHKIADNVLTFQMEQEWVAYVEATAPHRLMLGHGQVAGMKFVEQAINVADFEMEVWVDAMNHNEHRVRLAYINGTGVYVGRGHLEPMIMHEGFFNRFDTKAVPGIRAKKVQWAGGKIVAEDEYGVVSIYMSSQDGALGAAIANGRKEDVRWNSEGAVLILESDRHLRLCCNKLSGGDSMASALSVEIEEPDSLFARIGKSMVEISSQHPGFARRPVAMTEEAGRVTRIQPVVFFGKPE